MVLGAGGRATTRIPQGPAVPTAGITMVIQITADPPPSSKLERHRHRRWHWGHLQIISFLVVCIPSRSSALSRAPNRPSAVASRLTSTDGAPPALVSLGPMVGHGDIGSKTFSSARSHCEP